MAIDYRSDSFSDAQPDAPTSPASSLMSALDIERVATVAPEILDCITGLHAANLQLRKFERPMGPEEAVAAMRGLEDARRRLESLEATVLSVLERCGVPEELGQPSTKALVQQDLHLSGPEAARRVRRARNLGGRVDFCGQPLEPAYPELADRLHSGDLSSDEVDEIAKTCDKLGPTAKKQHGGEVEKHLAEAANSVQVKELGKLGKQALNHVDPQGACPRDEVDPEARHISLTELRNGEWKLSGLLGPVEGSLFHGLLNRRSATKKPGTEQTPDGESLDNPGTAPDSATLANPGTAPDMAPQTDAATEQLPAELTHDANTAPEVNSVLRGLNIDGSQAEIQLPYDPAAGRKRQYSRFVQILSRLGSDQAIAGPAYALVVTATAEQVAEGRGEVEAQTGSTLELADVLKLSPGGQFYYHSTAKGSRTVEVRTTNRFANKAQLAVLTARDQGCTFPDCDKPVGACDAHHLIPHSRGGPTDINNLAMVCSYHHHWHEKHGWEGTMINGLPAWIPPPDLDPDQKPIVHSKFKARLGEASCRFDQTSFQF